ncbi:unnamed protein product [Ambrosiozyma monospora]|uniref:Unnamed protein product n=1 Tax=Ambrosiozyma monospora TaxID=43982 RepID=A0A9W7DII8_AMBMO|nr:unnamed protein product [Ambrosiozyma monospora]
MFSTLRRRFNRNSLDDDDSEGGAFNDSTSQTKKSRRPPNTAFRQQRLKAWQPILVPRVVLPMLLLVAIVCVPIGIGFMYATYNIQLLEIDYSKCEKLASDSYDDIPGKYTTYHFKNNKKSSIQWKFNNDTDNDSATCTLKFDIPGDIKDTIYLYYKLTNFYQNHRKYVDSYDWNQLRGEAVGKDDLSNKCSPMNVRDNKVVYPCGLVANSLFNDTINDPVDTSSKSSYTFDSTGIAWGSDLSKYKKSQYDTDDIVPPENWMKKYPKGYADSDLEALAKDERFMNWMKTAALPSFYKLYGKNKETFKKGTYEMDIELNYPVSIFGGSKSIAFSTSSVIGGRHMGLGICFIIVGGIAVVFMLIFLVKHVFTRKQSDHAFLEGLNDGSEERRDNPEDEVLRDIL